MLIKSEQDVLLIAKRRNFFMKGRQVVLYLKATGHKEASGTITFKPEYSDNRITEIEAIELLNDQLGEYRYHSFVNTEGQAISAKAQKELGKYRVEKIEDAPTFKEIAPGLMEFIDLNKDGKTPVIVHNATYFQRMFDFAMADMELDWFPKVEEEDDSLENSEYATDSDDNSELADTEFSTDSDCPTDSEYSTDSEYDSEKEEEEKKKTYPWTSLFNYCNVVDVGQLANKQGRAPRGFADLCEHFGVDTSDRDPYSAKKDGMLLAKLVIAINAAAQQKQAKHTIFGDTPVKRATVEKVFCDEKEEAHVPRLV